MQASSNVLFCFQIIVRGTCLLVWELGEVERSFPGSGRSCHRLSSVTLGGGDKVGLGCMYMETVAYMHRKV